jgi:hypothetical protein
MSIRAIKRIIIIVALTVGVAFSCNYFERQTGYLSAINYELFVRDREPIPNPNFLSGYPEDKTYYFQFNPKNILATIDQGKDIFSPISSDDFANTNNEYVDIKWSQADFLQVADALSKRVWNEPLNLEHWNVYLILLDGSCDDSCAGFYSFEITYYKTIKTGWEPTYYARHIDLIAGGGVARMGDGNFSTDFSLGYWENIEMAKFQTTADQAIRIAEEYRKKIAGFEDISYIVVNISPISKSPYSTHKYDWEIEYSHSNPTAFLTVYINPFTGKVLETRQCCAGTK